MKPAPKQKKKIIQNDSDAMEEEEEEEEAEEDSESLSEDGTGNRYYSDDEYGEEDMAFDLKLVSKEE